MTRYRTLDHPMMAAIAWDPQRPAERISEHILMVRATSNSYVVAGEKGDVVINTTSAHQATRAREKFEQLLGRPLDVAEIIFTQSHPDHTGGWDSFAGPQTETIVQDAFQQICAERKLLGPFFTPRNARVLGALIPPGTAGEYWFNAPDPEPLTTFADEHSFTCSGRRFTLISLSSGETLDSLGVWLPDEKTLFIGNWAGAIHGAFPNFYTARGDRDRSVTGWLHDCEKLIALEAELLITGHEEPIEGADAVKAVLTGLHDAVQYVHDETVTGMNAGKTLSELRSEIELPAHLQTKSGRGPTDWYVRTVWEEYAGWFHHDTTSELYATPPQAVWPEIAELAGGAGVLAQRARARLDRGEAEEALHIIEIAHAAAPDDREVLEAQLAIYEALADATGGRSFDLLGWLEGRIMATERALGEE